MIQPRTIDAVCFKLCLEGLIEHLELCVGAFGICPASLFLVITKEELLNRLILVIIGDTGLVEAGICDFDRPVGAGCLHFVWLKNNVI